jgi:hypothetical protein
LTNKTLDLAELNLKRMEKSLDVERIIQSHLDLEQLLNSLMSKRSLWLFRQARSRVTSLLNDKIQTSKETETAENIFD